jgi:hypothetical protein
VPRNLWGRGYGWPLIHQGHAGGQWTLRRRSMGSRAIGSAQQAIFRNHAARGHASEVVLRIGPDAGGSRGMVPGRHALWRSEQCRAGGTVTWLEAAVIQRPGVSDAVGHIWTLKGRGVLGCHAGDARPRIIGCFRVGTRGASRDMDIVGAIHPIGSEHVSAVRGCAPRFRAGSGPRLGRNGVHGRVDVISKGLGSVTDRCPPSSGGRCRRVVLERAESEEGCRPGRTRHRCSASSPTAVGDIPLTVLCSRAPTLVPRPYAGSIILSPIYLAYETSSIDRL